MAAAGGVQEPLLPPCAFSPRSRDLLAISSVDGRIQVWDTRVAALRREYVPSAHLSATCTCLAWAPARGIQETHQKKRRKSEAVESDESYDLLTIGTATGDILIYSIGKGELQSRLVSHRRKVNCVRWHQDNSCLYSCSQDCHIVEWNTQTYKVKCKWKGDNVSVNSLCISPDGRMLLSAGRTIKLWDLQTKEVTRQFTGHSTLVTSLMFMPVRAAAESQTPPETTGLYFLSGSVHDRLISVWQVRTEKMQRSAVLTFTLTDSPVAVDLAPSDSKEKPMKLAVVCRDGQMHLFEHVLNGSHKKPLAPTCTVQIAASGGDGNSTPKPVSIHSAGFCPDKQSMVLYYGSPMQPLIEKLVLKTDEPHICLIRDVKKTLTIRSEMTVTKVKTPVVKAADTKVLIPGVPGHSAAVTLNSEKQEGKRKPGDQEDSIEDRLGAMDITLSKAPTKTHLPKVDHFSVLLLQGLESCDSNILNKVFQLNNETVIKKTVAKLPVHCVVPLVNEITKRLQGHPNSAMFMVRWMKAALVHHAPYLSALPDLSAQLGPLYQFLEMRVKALQKLSRLNGKLYLLITQIGAFQTAQRTSAKGSQEAKLVYEEESSEDEEPNEEHKESDDNWEEEDEEAEEEEESEREEESEGSVEDSEEEMEMEKVNSDFDPGNESEEE